MRREKTALLAEALDCVLPTVPARCRIEGRVEVGAGAGGGAATIVSEEVAVDDSDTIVTSLVLDC